MLVISTRTFRDSQKKYFDLAQKERVIVKRKNDFVELVPRGKIIPDNPSPSNDPWFNDPKNIEELNRSVQKAKEGKVSRVKDSDELQQFLKSL